MASQEGELTDSPALERLPTPMTCSRAPGGQPQTRSRSRSRSRSRTTPNAHEPGQAPQRMNHIEQQEAVDTCVSGKDTHGEGKEPDPEGLRPDAAGRGPAVSLRSRENDEARSTTSDLNPDIVVPAALNTMMNALNDITAAVGALRNAWLARSEEKHR